MSTTGTGGDHPNAQDQADGLARRLTRYPLTWRLWGLWLSRKFTEAGWLACGDGFPKPRVVNWGGQLKAGNCLFFSGVRLEVGRGANLTIGTRTFLNRNVEIIAARDIRIGRDCKIGWDVIILDTDQHPVQNRPLDIRPVVIGDNVWVGARAIILKGVTIGEGAVIGAGAIVTTDVPAGAVVTGPRAQVIRRRSLI